MRPISTKDRKIANDPTRHYPNTDEAKVLRRIMAETGLTEEEVRAEKKYRQELSKARLSGQKAKRSDAEKWCHNIIKKACRETQLAKEHPKTIEAIDRILAERKSGGWGFGYRSLFLYSNEPENAIKMYVGKAIDEYVEKIRLENNQNNRKEIAKNVFNNWDGKL